MSEGDNNGHHRPLGPLRLHPYNIDEEDMTAAGNGDQPATPAYRRNMSQLTLPPEYFSDSNIHNSSQAGPSDQKRKTSDDSHLDSSIDSHSNMRRHDFASRNVDEDGQDENSPLSPGRGHHTYEGDTLVSKSTKGMPDQGQTVHYPDEHGGLLHAMPSPGYPDPRPPRIEPVRTFSGNGSVANTDDEYEEVDEMYDWSDEEDLVDQEAKFENKLSSSKKKKGWGPRRYATSFKFFSEVKCTDISWFVGIESPYFLSRHL